jgi:hypothetical protein
MKKKTFRNAFRVKKLDLRVHQEKLKAIPAAGRWNNAVWLIFVACAFAAACLFFLPK